MDVNCRDKIMNSFRAIYFFIILPLLIFVLACSSSIAQTNHSEDQTALARAVNNSIGADCFSIKRFGYTVVYGGEISRSPISVIVDEECLKEKYGFGVKTVTAIISWSAPTHRENNDLIKEGELKKYEIHEINEVSSDKTSFKKELIAGKEYIFSVLAEDIYGLKSELSEGFYIEVPVKF